MKFSDKTKNYLYLHPWWMVILILLIGVGLKVILLITGSLPFNADEAVVGLMAGHILSGDVPVFFYGQSYMGSLDALLVAGAFLLCGKSVLAIRVIQIILFCGTVITTYQLAFKFTGKVEAGWIAALLLSIPTVNVTLYTTISLGGYGEALFLGNLLLLMGIRVIQKNEWYALLLLGNLAGLGLWINGLTLVYSLPVIILILMRADQKRNNPPYINIWKTILLIAVGGLLGAIPWWIYGLRYGFVSLVSELFGSAILTEVDYIAGVGLRLISFIIFGLTVILGLRPPWEIRWLFLPLIPLTVGIWIFILTGFRKILRNNPALADGGFLMIGIMSLTIAGFILTPFGNDPSGRYFLPIAVSLAIIGGIYLAYMESHLKRWRWMVLAILIVFNLGGTIQCWQRTPPGLTTQFDANTIFNHDDMDELILFLKTNSISRGYTTYWLSYPLAFLTDETLIFAPRLPYHMNFSYTRRDDRYPAYDELVSISENMAYLTARQPWLDEYIRRQFDQMNVTWQEKIIGDFTIFYELSSRILPNEIGLGETTIKGTK